MRKASSRSSAWRGAKAALGERRLQRLGFRIGGPAAGQRRVEPVEHRELLVRRELRMVGDVVGGAHEAIEGEDRPAMLRLDQPRGDGKILVAVALAGAGFGRGDHQPAVPPAEAAAWKRPFHAPPRPRQCWIADSSVKAV